MVIICPVTGKACPYEQKLNSGVCPREHECDIIRAEYAGMLKKPPSPRKYIYISLAVVLVLATAAVLYFFVFDGTLDFLKASRGVSETTSMTPSPTPTPFSTVEPTVAPTAVPTPVPTNLPAVPITEADPSSVVRINVAGILHEVKKVGLDKDLKIKAYPDARIVSWYEGSYLPGGAGNSILFGFKYFGGVSGTFDGLDTLVPGDKIGFTLDNGKTLELEVYDTESYAKDSIPPSVFELENSSPHTVLITQTGEIDPETLDYKDMLVVFLH